MVLDQVTRNENGLAKIDVIVDVVTVAWYCV